MPTEFNIEEEPDEAYIDSMRGYLHSLWNDAREQWAIVDTYYKGTMQLWPTGSSRPEWLKSSRGGAIVDHAVDHLLSHEPKVKRWPLGEEDDDALTADAVEVAVQAIMHQIALKEPSLTWKQAAKHMMLYGYAVVEDAIHSESLRSSRDKPKKRRSENPDDFDIRMQVWQNRKKTLMPFRTRAPHPSQVLLDPYQKEPSVALKLTRRTHQELYEITRARLNPDGTRNGGKPRRSHMEVNLWEDRTNPFDFEDGVEYWTEWWHALVVNGSLLFKEPNDWHMMNFSHAFSGFGQESTHGTEGSDPNPKELAVGLLNPILPVLKAHAQAVSGMHNALMWNTWLRRFTTEDASEIAVQLSRDDIIEVSAPGTMWIEDAPAFSRWMFEAMGTLDKDIEFGTFSRSQAGIRQQGVGTVGQQAILDTASGRKFIAPTAQLQHLATVSASHIMQFIQTLDLEIRVEGTELNKSMIMGDYSNKVTFEVIDPVIQMQLQELGLAQIQAGVLSDITYMEDFMKLENVSREQFRLIAMAIRKLPPVQMKLALEAARRMGLEDLLEEEIEGELAGGPGGGQAGGGSQILGPDGNPLASSLGAQSPQQGANQIMGAARQLRQPLTPNAAKPGRTGQNLAG